MIETLATLNENIISLGESLKVAGFVGTKEKDRIEQVKKEIDNEGAKDPEGQQEDPM